MRGNRYQADSDRHGAENRSVTKMDSSVVEVSPESLQAQHEPLSGRSKAMRIIMLGACACLLISVSALVVRNAEESAVRPKSFDLRRRHG